MTAVSSITNARTGSQLPATALVCPPDADVAASQIRGREYRSKRNIGESTCMFGFWRDVRNAPYPATRQPS